MTIVEAQELLGNFDAALRTYAAKKLRKRNIDIIEKVSKEQPIHSKRTASDHPV